MKRYILDAAGEPHVEEDLLRWARWFEGTERHVGETMIGSSRVSTVFLGIDHNWQDAGPPVLWESMVFGGALDQEQRRYRSRAEALAGHEQLCAEVRAAEGIQ